MRILNKLFFITNTSNKSLVYITIVILLTSFTDVLSLSLILPYSKVILNDYSMFENLKFLDEFLLIQTNNEIFYFLSFTLIISFILKFFITILLRYIIIKYTHGKLPSLQLSLAKKYQSLSLSEKNLKKDSDIIRNVKVLSENTISCLDNVLRLIAETIILIVISTYLLYVNARFFIIIASIIFFFGFFFNKTIRPLVYTAGQKRMEADSKIILLIQDLISSFKEIRVLGKENFFVPSLTKSAGTVYKSVLINNIATIIPRYAIELIIILFFVSYATINFDNKIFINSVLPNLAVFGFASLRIIPLSSSIIRSWVNLRYNLPIINTIYNDFKFNQKKNKPEIKKIKFIKLELKNISFEYEKTKIKVLDQINFKIEKKQTIGILGVSGSGKTTFVNLLIGLLDLKKGKIYLNGKILKDRLHNKIKVSYIAQDNLVLKDNIKRNISLENNEEFIDELKLKNSIKFSNLNNVLQKNKISLESEIGKDGLSLSGGESKRLSIARALYHDSELLIMDEATNSLDEENRIEIRKYLKLLKSKMAIIIISHNQDDLNHCDIIYKIDNGNIFLKKKNEK